MISIRQDIPGYITIDSSEEPEFSSSPDIIELTSGLFGVRQIHPQVIITEATSQPSSVLFYIWESLTSSGYAVDYDPDSERLLRQYREEELLVKAIRKNRIKATPLKAPSKYGISRPLLKHQREAIGHALAVHHAANFSVPGSGKTSVALSTFAVLRHEKVVDKLLVIGPASSFAPWEDEFRLTFGYSGNVLRLIGSRAHRARLLQKLKDIDIVLCTYQMAYQERENLIKALKQARYFLALDESHHIKNSNLGPWALTALELSPFAERRMILSGTPAPHSLKDMWSQFTFLWPSQAVLGSLSQFEHRLESFDQPEALRMELAPFYKRTKKSDLKLPEPDSHFEKIAYSDIPHYQRLLIRLLELRTLQEARDLGLHKVDLSILRKWRRARAIRLLQVASNPALLYTPLLDLGSHGESLNVDPVISSLLKNHIKNEIPVKIAYVIRKVQQLVSNGQKVVVWATFVDNLRLLENLLSDLKPLLVYGDVPAYDEDTAPGFESRESKIRQFNDKSSGRDVLLANPAACSESISLHKICNNAVYLERTFNAGQFLQSMDRIHRVGMPKNNRPHYFIPLLECAIEKVVDQRLSARQRQLYQLLNDDMNIMGYDEDNDTFLTENEDDLDTLFQQVIQEIHSKNDEGSNSTSRGDGSRR